MLKTDLTNADTYWDVITTIKRTKFMNWNAIYHYNNLKKIRVAIMKYQPTSSVPWLSANSKESKNKQM